MKASIKTLQQAIQYFSDEQVCIDAVASLRWPDGKPSCPACGKTEHYWLASQKRWKCKECWKQFTVKLGTLHRERGNNRGERVFRACGKQGARCFYKARE